jgi:hypothetical protein
MGALQFYGTENGKKSGWARDYYRARDNEEAKDDPFAIHLEDEPGLKKLYHDAEHVGESSSELRERDKEEEERRELTSRWIPPRYECFRG